jgi:hypothetical protein
MDESLKGAVDKQLAIAKLEEKLHIELGEIDTPEQKLEGVLRAISAVSAHLMLKALLNLAMPTEVVIETLRKDDASKEEKAKANETIAFQMGGHIVKDIVDSLTTIMEVFKEQNND